MQLDLNSPVIHSASIKICAPAQKVWKVMSDIENWPSWNRDIESAKMSGKLSKGTTFTWKSGPGTITSTLEAVDNLKLLGWSGKMFGIKAVHIWRLETNGKFTIVTTEESWSGLIPRLLKGTSKKTLIKAINNGLAQLKTAVESSENKLR